MMQWHMRWCQQHILRRVLIMYKSRSCLWKFVDFNDLDDSFIKLLLAYVLSVRQTYYSFGAWLTVLLEQANLTLYTLQYVEEILAW